MTVKIAVIDSGINPGHSHVQGVAGGISYHLEASGKVVEGADFRDELGHGTAIAGVIREKNSQAKIYAVKIFHQFLEAPAALLMAAMQWAIRVRVNIIHLSLGTERPAKALSISGEGGHESSKTRSIFSCSCGEPRGCLRVAPRLASSLCTRKRRFESPKCRWPGGPYRRPGRRVGASLHSLPVSSLYRACFRR